MKNGNPNGLDCDETQLPEWKTYTENEPCEMVFTSKGPKPIVRKPTPFSDFLMDQMFGKLTGE